MVIKIEKFSFAKVGDTVWSLRLGSGKIVKIERYSDHPIRIIFDNPPSEMFAEEEHYYIDGRYTRDEPYGNRYDIFWSEQDYEDFKNGIIRKKDIDYEAEFNEHFKGVK